MKHILLAAAFLLLLVVPRAARAEADPQAFVQQSHEALERLLKQRAAAGRDAQIAAQLDAMVDYEELARRAFGKPCPPEVPKCENHWDALTAAQQAEVTDLLKQLVQKTYRKNLIKTLDYDITYRGNRAAAAGETRVRTEAKSKLKPRDPSVQVDYIVRTTNGAPRVVNLITEGSSLTKNYYTQFHKILTDPAQGYPQIVKKLKKKIAKN